MADDLQGRGAQDRARINLNEPHEVEYWTRKWNVSLEELKRAIARAGVGVKAVAKQLGKEAEE